MQPEVNVPDSVAELLWRVLAKAPADRPASAELMIAELDAAEASARVLESGVRPTLAAGRSRAPRWTGPVLVGGALGIVLLLVLVLFGPRRATAPVAEPVAASAALRLPVEPSPAEPAAPSSVSSLENSVNAMTSPTPSSASSVPPAKKGTLHAKPGLQKKGNERYGRFD
jgi:hypothetical protein